MNTEITAARIRKSFLPQAEQILNQYVDLALDNSPENKTLSDKAKEKIFDALVPVIQQAGDMRAIDASNTADILALLSKGQITLAEAKDLMHIISTKFEIDDLTSLMDKLEESK